ncbi:aspartic peptidase domain-containing protein [Xylariaceae sp. FL0016]|nr:aspartic peptidase domain-containing protein [Xylariaceae sp. FL0016]
MPLLNPLGFLARLLFLFSDGEAAGVSNPSGLLSFPIHPRPQVRSTVDKRDDQYIYLTGKRTSLIYFIQLSIGSPEQVVKLAVATSYNEQWVISDCYTTTTDPDLIAACEENGEYTSSDSTTSIDKGSSYEIQYADGSGANVTYFTDDISLTTGRVLNGVQFGVADNGTNSDLDQLASQQVTNSKAFSLALGNATSDGEGAVIFGGVDTQKSSGQLDSNKILPSPDEGGDADYDIHMASVGASVSRGLPHTYENSSMTVILDEFGVRDVIQQHHYPSSLLRDGSPLQRHELLTGTLQL